MGRIWKDLLAPEWLFTTIIMGLVVGVSASFVYDFFKAKGSRSEATIKPGRFKPFSKTTFRPTSYAHFESGKLFEYVVSIHIFLSVLSILGLIITGGIEADHHFSLIFDILFGGFFALTFVWAVGLFAESYPRAGWVIVALPWTLFLTLSAAAVRKGLTGSDLGLLAQFYSVIAVVTFFAVGIVVVLWDWIRPR